MSHSARASWERSLIPVSRPSSSTSSAATSRPSARASATRSVTYSSPDTADGWRSTIRRRSHAASTAYKPGVDLADPALLVGGVLVLDDPLDGAALVADHAAEAGRVDRVHGHERDRGVVQRSRLEQGCEQRSPHQRHVAVEHEDLGHVIGQHRGGRRTASPVPAAPPGARRRRSPATASRTASVAGEYTTTAGRRWRSTAASSTYSTMAGRTAGGAPWASSTASACRGRRPARWRRCGARACRGPTGHGTSPVAGARRSQVGGGRRWEGCRGSMPASYLRDRGRGRRPAAVPPRAGTAPRAPPGRRRLKPPGRRASGVGRTIASVPRGPIVCPRARPRVARRGRSHLRPPPSGRRPHEEERP